MESVIGGPETYAKQPFMEVTNDDVKSILSFIKNNETATVIGDSKVL
jgi:hypothetical protein